MTLEPRARRRASLLGGLLPGSLLAGLLLCLMASAPVLAQDAPPGPAEAGRGLEQSRVDRLRQAERLRRAGDAASARGGVYEAIESYNQALSALGDIDVEAHADLYLSLARSQARLGDCQAARESLRQASGALTGNPERASSRLALASSVNAVCPR